MVTPIENQKIAKLCLRCGSDNVGRQITNGYEVLSCCNGCKCRKTLDSYYYSRARDGQFWTISYFGGSFGERDAASRIKTSVAMDRSDASKMAFYTKRENGFVPNFSDMLTMGFAMMSGGY